MNLYILNFTNIQQQLFQTVHFSYGGQELIESIFSDIASSEIEFQIMNFRSYCMKKSTVNFIERGTRISDIEIEPSEIFKVCQWLQKSAETSLWYLGMAQIEIKDLQKVQFLNIFQKESPNVLVCDTYVVNLAVG